MKWGWKLEIDHLPSKLYQRGFTSFCKKILLCLMRFPKLLFSQRKGFACLFFFFSDAHFFFSINRANRDGRSSLRERDVRGLLVGLGPGWGCGWATWWLREKKVRIFNVQISALALSRDCCGRPTRAHWKARANLGLHAILTI